jgi:hypothetical protein
VVNETGESGSFGFLLVTIGNARLMPVTNLRVFTWSDVAPSNNEDGMSNLEATTQGRSSTVRAIIDQSVRLWISKGDNADMDDSSSDGGWAMV